MMETEDVVTVIPPLIHCATCRRNYFVIKGLFQRREMFVDVSIPLTCDVPIVDCDECTAAMSAAINSAVATASVDNAGDPSVDSTVVDTPINTSVINTPKPRIDLYVKICADAICTGPIGDCQGISIYGCTEESIKTDTWVVMSWAYDNGHVRDRRKYYSKMMSSMHRFLEEVRESYDIRWQIPRGSISKLWLEHLYVNYAPLEMPPLGLDEA